MCDTCGSKKKNKCSCGTDATYKGSDLLCSNIEYGDTFEEALQKIDAILCCELGGVTFEGNPNCEGGGLVVRKGDDILYQVCFPDCGCDEQQFTFEDKEGCENGITIRNHEGDIVYDKCYESGGSSYTYIRFASDDDGADFSQTKNDGDIERCFQAIITSPTKLDEDEPSFESLFNSLWFNICDCGCNAKDCVNFPINTPDYITHNGENVWNFTNSTSPIYELDTNVENGIKINSFSDVPTNEELLVPNFIDNNNNPLSPETDYCVEFEFDWGSMYSDLHYATIDIKFGSNGEIFTIDNSSPERPNKFKFIIKTGEGGGLITQNTLVLKIDSWEGFDEVFIYNLKVNSVECCNDCGCLPPLPPNDNKTYGIQNGDWVEITNSLDFDVEFNNLSDCTQIIVECNRTVGDGDYLCYWSWNLPTYRATSPDISEILPATLTTLPLGSISTTGENGSTVLNMDIKHIDNNDELITLDGNIVELQVVIIDVESGKQITKFVKVRQGIC